MGQPRPLIERLKAWADYEIAEGRDGSWYQGRRAAARDVLLILKDPDPPAPPDAAAFSEREWDLLRSAAIQAEEMGNLYSREERAACRDLAERIGALRQVGILPGEPTPDAAGVAARLRELADEMGFCGAEYATIDSLAALAWADQVNALAASLAAQLREIADELRKAAATGDCATIYETATDVVPSLDALAAELAGEGAEGDDR